MLDDHDRVVGLVSRILPGSMLQAFSGLAEDVVDGVPVQHTLLSSVFCLPPLSGIVAAPPSPGCGVALADPAVFEQLAERYQAEWIDPLGDGVRYSSFLTPHRVVDPPGTTQSAP